MIQPVPTPKKFVSAVIQSGSRFLALKFKKDGSWRFPGGKPEGDETDAQTLVREVFEEVGVHVTALTYLTNVTLYCDGDWWTGNYYLVTSYIGVPALQEPHKMERLAWLCPDELRESEQFVVNHVR